MQASQVQSSSLSSVDLAVYIKFHAVAPAAGVACLEEQNTRTGNQTVKFLLIKYHFRLWTDPTHGYGSGVGEWVFWTFAITSGGRS